MSEINIAGKCKATILAKLYNASSPRGMGFLQATPNDMSVNEAQQILDDGQTYFDYLKGRVMKIDLSGDTLRTDLYNRDNGYLAAENILQQL